MKTNQYRWSLLWIAFIAAFAITGCAAVISQESLQEVNPEIRFEQLLKDPDGYRGNTVLLGGDIITTENLPDKTVIIVLQRSLGYRQEPALEGESQGRFMVSAPGFLDPAIYRTGRRITVVGLVVGKEVRPLDKLEYTYPVIEKKELYIWPPKEAATGEPQFHFGIGIGKTF